jgi:DNA replication protein DnaC
MHATTAEPRSIQELLRTFETRGGPQPEKTGFVQEFETCDTHGKWPTNMQDAEGKTRWNQPGCPHCRQQAKTQALVSTADISRRFMDCSFENYRAENTGQVKALSICKDYAENFKGNLAAGRCLIMRGNPGTGKNHLSAAIMIEVMKQNYTALRIKAGEFLDEYWAKGSGDNRAWLQQMSKVDLLVIDEIGRTSNGKAAKDSFFRLIDARYEEVKPTIVISNLEIAGLKETLGDAAYDRLREGGGSMVSFTWDSGRGE